LKKQRFLVLTLALVHSILLVDAQEDWKLSVDKDGIKIYSKSISQSKIKALKVVCNVKARLTQVAAVFLDIKTQDEWFYNTKSILLEQVSPSELYYYAEIGFPWPLSNRDYIAHINLFQNPITKVITMDVQNVPDFVTVKQGIVRVRQSICKWVVTPAGENITLIEFTLFADPAGSIPSWLINIFSKKGPFESFKKLRTHLKKPGYIDVFLPFIKD